MSTPRLRPVSAGLKLAAFILPASVFNSIAVAAIGDAFAGNGHNGNSNLTVMIAQVLTGSLIVLIEAGIMKRLIDYLGFRWPNLAVEGPRETGYPWWLYTGLFVGCLAAGFATLGLLAKTGIGIDMFGYLATLVVLMAMARIVLRGFTGAPLELLWRLVRHGNGPTA